VLKPATAPEDFRARIAPFLHAHGFAGDCAIEPVAGGGNNRVYRVSTGSCTGLLKAYFQNPADPRDRFGAERAFYDYLWSYGVRCTPEPLGWDDEQRLGLFTFVPGRKLRSEEITTDSVAQALAFISELNSARTTEAARRLPAASEACFCLADHIKCVERRVLRIGQIEAASPRGREAAEFVAEELNPAWQKVRASCGGQIPANAPLSPALRCLSPSDFGFHNALMTAGGRLQFFDFEYAGWDDPAKLACDFFCQPELPVHSGFWHDFVGRLTATLDPDPTFAERARRLLPAYQIKWCCILLNDFLAVDRTRREFALGKSSDARKAAQLNKARKALAHVRLEG
jgi:hypothetical protein